MSDFYDREAADFQNVTVSSLSEEVYIFSEIFIRDRIIDANRLFYVFIHVPFLRFQRSRLSNYNENTQNNNKECVGFCPAYTCRNYLVCK